MELKDVILSTLAEMDEAQPTESQSQKVSSIVQRVDVLKKISLPDTPVEKIVTDEEPHSTSELNFLVSLREKLLVLFEGFQAPNNANLEAKIDLTLNFLEFVLVSIDSRIEECEKRDISR